MKRSLGRNWRGALWAFTLLLVSGGGVLAQAPEQHWQPTPNYPANYPPNYQPSTAPAGPPATGNPVAGQYQNPQQPDQPVGPPQYPTIDRRPAGPAGAGRNHGRGGGGMAGAALGGMTGAGKRMPPGQAYGTKSFCFFFQKEALKPCSFFEKKNQKTFTLAVFRRGGSAPG